MRSSGDPRSSPPSIEPAPRSSSPIVASAAPLSSKLPFGFVALALLGGVVFLLLQRSLGPKDVAGECLRAALAGSGTSASDQSLAVEIVTAGKLDVGGRDSKQIVNGLLSDPGRREAVEHCRAVYARKLGVSPVLPLLEVERIAALIRVERALGRSSAGSSGPGDTGGAPVAGAEVFVESFPGHGNCITSSLGRCELVLRNLAHDARLDIAAKLPNGRVVTQPASVIELLQHGLKLEARERAAVIEISVVSCKDRSPVSGVIVEAAASGARVWSTRCGPEPPVEPENCRDSVGRNGHVSFHYDTRPQSLLVTLRAPGDGRLDTREVSLGARDTLELTYDDAVSPGDCRER